MSAFADALAAVQREIPAHKRCRVGLLLEQLDSTDKALAAELREVLASDIPHTTLKRALDKIGQDVGIDSIRRHRSPECNCPR